MHHTLLMDVAKAIDNLSENEPCRLLWQLAPPSHVLEQVTSLTGFHEKKIV